MKTDTPNKYMVTYGTPIVYNPKGMMVLHVDTGEEPKPKKWFEKLWDALKKIPAPIQSAMDIIAKKIVNLLVLLFTTPKQDKNDVTYDKG